MENRPGGGGNIGAEAVVRSAPDGYTLLMIDATPAVNATLYDKLNFDVLRDIAAIAAVAQQPQMMLVHPSVPAKTVPEFIAYAKANAGKINMASGGTGSPPHMAGELFKLTAGIDLLHVPYRGTGAAYADLLGGRVQVAFFGPVSAMEHVKIGTLRALAVTAASVGAICQTFQPSPNSCRVMRPIRGSVSPRRKIYPPKSCSSSTKKLMPLLPILRSSRELPNSGQHTSRLACRLRQAHRRRNREVGQGGTYRQHQAGVIPAQIFRNVPFRERGPLYAEAHSPLVSRSLRNGAARWRSSQDGSDEQVFGRNEQTPG